MPVTRYNWDVVNDCVLSEMDETGTTTAKYTNEPGPFGSVISQRRNGESYFYHYDGLGSARQLTDSSENVVNTNLYDAWGVNVASTETVENPFKWVGESGYYFDEELNQYCVRARNYNGGVARWQSADSAATTRPVRLFAMLA